MVSPLRVMNVERAFLATISWLYIKCENHMPIYVMQVEKAALRNVFCSNIQGFTQATGYHL